MLAVRLHRRGQKRLSGHRAGAAAEPCQLLARVDAAGVCSSILKLVAQGEDHSTFINEAGLVPISRDAGR